MVEFVNSGRKPPKAAGKKAKAAVDALDGQDLQLSCTHCQRPFVVLKVLAGRETTCPGCGKPVDVPALKRAATPSAAAAKVPPKTDAPSAKAKPVPTPRLPPSADAREGGQAAPQSEPAVVPLEPEFEGDDEHETPTRAVDFAEVKVQIERDTEGISPETGVSSNRPQRVKSEVIPPAPRKKSPALPLVGVGILLAALVAVYFFKFGPGQNRGTTTSASATPVGTPPPLPERVPVEVAGNGVETAAEVVDLTDETGEAAGDVEVPVEIAAAAAPPEETAAAVDENVVVAIANPVPVVEVVLPSAPVEEPAPVEMLAFEEPETPAGPEMAETEIPAEPEGPLARAQALIRGNLDARSPLLAIGEQGKFKAEDGTVYIGEIMDIGTETLSLRTVSGIRIVQMSILSRSSRAQLVPEERESLIDALARTHLDRNPDGPKIRSDN
jgi:hypothetical protein